MDKKLDFYSNIKLGKDLDEQTERTLSKCFSVMRSQVYTPEGVFNTRWTTPDRLPHKKLWLWDSVFHSMGNKYISTALAYESLRAVFSTQREDGFIPHMSAPSADNSEITQPPVLAWGLYSLYEYIGQKAILQECFDSLQKYLLWFKKNRDCNKNNLFQWKVWDNSTHCRCDESGMDNSPRFDNVTDMDCIDLSCFMANEVRIMARIARLLDKRNEEEFWLSLYKSICNAVNENLWDEEDRFYYDKIHENGEFKKVKAISGFLPLFSGICKPYQAEALVRHITDEKSFNTLLPIPSISVDNPVFGTDMWRGPVWINYNYMIALGLKENGYEQQAKDIIRKTVDSISFWYHQEGTIYEFYDSSNIVSPKRLNRKGKAIEPYDFRVRAQSIRDYGWSCSLFTVMMMEMYED